MSFFPVELLKEDGEKYFINDCKTTFISSGTTQSKRSKSCFSHDGLFLYKINAIVGFIDVLLKTGHDPDDFAGLSLIPDCKAWPNSSLAQMIEWFTDYFDVSYIDNQDHIEIKKLLSKREKPTWIFGTAFNYVNLLDHMQARSRNKLVPNHDVFIFETGGTKGLSRSISRKALYKLIHEKLGIPLMNIGSEYGMCELASQAWSFRMNKKYISYEAPYQFAKHVSLQVTQGLRKTQKSGKGSLIITDPSRVDLPLPIRVQDIVDLEADGSFQLLGRVPHSVLRGCSLLSEKDSPQTAPHKNASKRTDKAFQNYYFDEFHAKKIFSKVTEIFRSDKFFHSLIAEFKNPTIAQQALADLKTSFPDSFGKFKEGLLKSKPQKIPIFIIQPNTHSFSTIYPLVFTAALGLDVTIRIEQEAFPAIDLIADELKANGCQIETIEKSFRFDSANSSLYADHLVVAFGTNWTTAHIDKILPNKVNKFGTVISATLVDKPDKDKLELALKDFYSLNQLGCMSSRTLLLPAKQIQLVKAIIENNCTTNYAKRLADICALDHEEFKLKTKNVEIIKRKSPTEALFPIYSLRDGLDWEDVESQRLFILPLIFYNNVNEAFNFLEKLIGLKYISTDLTNTVLPGVETRNLGQLNISHWDGTLQGKSLFQPTIEDS